MLSESNARGGRAREEFAPGGSSALDGAKKILAGSASGRVPTPDDVKTLERANSRGDFDGSDRRGRNEARWPRVPRHRRGRRIRHSESSRARCLRRRPAAPLRIALPTPLEKRLSDVNAANEEVPRALPRRDSKTHRRRAQSSQFAEMSAFTAHASLCVLVLQEPHRPSDARSLARVEPQRTGVLFSEV